MQIVELMKITEDLNNNLYRRKLSFVFRISEKNVVKQIFMFRKVLQFITESYFFILLFPF